MADKATPLSSLIPRSHLDVLGLGLGPRLASLLLVSVGSPYYVNSKETRRLKVSWLPGLAFSWCVCQLQAFSCLPFLESLHRCYIWQMFERRETKQLWWTHIDARTSRPRSWRNLSLNLITSSVLWACFHGNTPSGGGVYFPRPISCSRLTKIGELHLPDLSYRVTHCVGHVSANTRAVL